MPTGTPLDRPFAPLAPPTREELLAHARGELPVERTFALEHGLEGDPLLREAVEGLAMPGALAGLDALERARPTKPPGTAFSWWPWAGSAVVVLMAGLWYLGSGGNAVQESGTRGGMAGEATPGEALQEHVYLPLEREEIMAAVEQPESLQIGHGNSSVQAKPELWTTPAPREEGIERIALRRDPAEPDSEFTERRPRNGARTSRQLHYVHDLKLVHPRELYGDAEPLLDPRSHVALDDPNAATREVVREPERYANYLDYMNDALDKFTRNDHKGCLEDLRFLLEQYPNDVNALFYAGLCSYDLGLYERARAFLHRSATHTIDTFDEESEYYHAMALERLGEKDAAREAFERIVARDGFYAQRARERLR